MTDDEAEQLKKARSDAAKALDRLMDVCEQPIEQREQYLEQLLKETEARRASLEELMQEARAGRVSLETVEAAVKDFLVGLEHAKEMSEAAMEDTKGHLVQWRQINQTLRDWLEKKRSELEKERPEENR
jgi:hypothetical protein